MRSLALHEFAGVYRGVHSIDEGIAAGVSEIVISITSRGINIAQATLQGAKTDAYSANEVHEVSSNEAEVHLTEDYQNYRAFRVGQHIMAISHQTDERPSLLMLGGPDIATLFGPNQMEVFHQKIDIITDHMGPIPRLDT